MTEALSPAGRRAAARGFGKTPKSERTRRRIMDAAIACLADYGYAATNMSLVAETAGPTRGSVQYYFPTRVSLMAGLAADILERRRVSYAAAMADKADPIDRLWGLSAYGREEFASPLHLAAMELQLATRGDPELAAVLRPQLREEYDDGDQSFTEDFADLGFNDEELRMLRKLLSAYYRGLAIESVNNDSIKDIKPYQDFVIRMVDAVRKKPDTP